MTTRRDTLAWFFRALSFSALAPGAAFAAVPGSSPPAGPGYGTDPNLKHPVRPWPLTLDKAQLLAVSRLADLILPADEHAPAASALGVPAFVDEWVSAPYPSQAADRKTILAGLLWLDQAAGGRFAGLSEDRAGQILDSICNPHTSSDAKAAHFFQRFRAVCMAGYYTTPEGWAAIGYVGNKPSQTFPDPPAEVLAKLKI